MLNTFSSEIRWVTAWVLWIPLKLKYYIRAFIAWDWKARFPKQKISFHRYLDFWDMKNAVFFDVLSICNTILDIFTIFHPGCPKKKRSTWRVNKIFSKIFSGKYSYKKWSWQTLKQLLYHVVYWMNFKYELSCCTGTL